MSIRANLIRCALLATTAIPAAASAVPLSSAFPLEVYQEVTPGFITPPSYVVSNSPGLIAVNYCFDAVACVNGYSDVEIGAAPSLTHQTSATGIGDDEVGGGDSGSYLDYYVELVDPGKTADEIVDVMGNDTLIANGVGRANYLVKVDAVNRSDGLHIQDCTTQVQCYYNLFAQGQLSTIHSIMLKPNTIYGVHEEVDTYNGSLTGNGAFAQIEGLKFSLPGGSTGMLEESAGIGGPVPEPRTWALMLIGFGFAGAFLRRRRSSRTLDGVSAATALLALGAVSQASAASLVLETFANPAVPVSYSSPGSGVLVFQAVLPGPPPLYVNSFSFINPESGLVTATIGDGAATLTSPADSFNYLQLGFGNAALDSSVAIDTTPYHYVKFSFNSGTEAENLAYTIFSYTSDVTTGVAYDINGTNDVPAVGGGPFNAYIPIDVEAGFDYADVNGGLFQVIGGGNYSLASISLTSSAPEPSSWALMLIGLGLAGGMARRRRTLAL